MPQRKTLQQKEEEKEQIKSLVDAHSNLKPSLIFVNNFRYTYKGNFYLVNE